MGGKNQTKKPPQTNRQTANLRARTPSVKGITAQEEWRLSRDSLQDFLEWKESHGAFSLFGQALYTGPHPRSPKFILGNLIWLKSCLLRGGWSTVKGWNQVTFKGPMQPDNTRWILQTNGNRDLIFTQLRFLKPHLAGWSSMAYKTFMFLSCVSGIRIKLKASDTIDFLALTLWNIHCDRFQRKYSKLGEYPLGPGISIPVLQNISEKKQKTRKPPQMTMLSLHCLQESKPPLP